LHFLHVCPASVHSALFNEGTSSRVWNQCSVRAQIHPKIDTAFLPAPLTGVAAQPSGGLESCSTLMRFAAGLVSASAANLENSIGSAVAAVTGVRCRMGFPSFYFTFARRDFQLHIPTATALHPTTSSSHHATPHHTNIP
jgi:hypothetical protein